MKTVFKLCFVTSVRQLTPILMLVLVVVLPFVFTGFTNYEVDPAVLEPARVQSAWQVAWLLSLFWSLFYSAHTSAHLVESRMGEYLKSAGVLGGQQLLGIWASAMVYVLIISVIPALFSLYSFSGEMAEANAHWGILSLQHSALLVISLAGLNYLSAAIASRVGATIGFAVPLSFALAGMYFVPLLKKLVAGSEFFLLDVLYTLLPHYYLADVTHRFVHEQGAMTTLEFFAVFEYFAGWAILCAVVATCIYTPKGK